MPLAVTHVLLTIIIVDLFRDYVVKHKKFFTLHTVMIAGIAGLLPDIDVPITWILNGFGYTVKLLEHGGITHSLLFGLLFLIPGLYYFRKKNFKFAGYFFVIFFGTWFHLFLDYTVGGGGDPGMMLFWPFTTATFKLHLLEIVDIDNIFLGIDAIILLLWLWHEEMKHKILDYI